jgi:hypothetical protein
VAGLHWLEEGTARVGSAGENDIVLPHGAPPHVGVLQVERGAVRFASWPGTAVRHGDARVDSLELSTDRDSSPTVLASGSVTFRVIDRSGHLALRVKDSLSHARLAFAGLEYFPVDTTWRVPARLEPTPGNRLKVINIVGLEEDFASPGRLVFTTHGRTLSLQVAQEKGDSSYFIIFRDSTSASATYPAGRYLAAPPVDSTGWTVLDFNRAYNPPCAFTAYATCPLPPPQNILPVAIEAGELRYGAAHAAVVATAATP